MIDCPNCGAQVDESAPVCPNCGFDIHSQAAETVRRLREEGKVHPGREGATDPNEFSGPAVRGGPDEELPAEDLAREGPEEFDAGL